MWCTIAVLVNTSPSQGSDFQMQDKVWLPQALSHIFNVERNKFTQISDFTDTEILAVTTQYRKLYKPDLSHQRSRSVTEFLEVVRKAALSLSLSSDGFCCKSWRCPWPWVSACQPGSHLSSIKTWNPSVPQCAPVCLPLFSPHISPRVVDRADRARLEIYNEQTTNKHGLMAGQESGCQAGRHRLTRCFYLEFLECGEGVVCYI